MIYSAPRPNIELPRPTRANTFFPRGEVLAGMRCKSDEVLIDGPAGTGKSIGLLQKIYHLCEGRPGVRCGIVRKTRASLTESALVTFESKVLPEGHSSKGRGHRVNRHAYTFPNGSEIIIAGIDKPERIMSTDFDVFYVQEATELSENDWEMLTTRLRHGSIPYQQIIADCNPQAPSHWLKRRCDAGRCKLFSSRHEDNPLLWDRARNEWTPQGEKYIAKLDALTGVRKERLRYGRWVQASGVVYESYDSHIHLIDRFTVPKEWRRYRSVDFGYTNPFVCQWWTLDHDGRAYLYRQIYRTKRIVQDHCADIVRLTGSEVITQTVADHDAEDRATMERHGVSTVPAKKAIRYGIDLVEARLRPAGDGKPRLFIMRDSLIERDNDLDDAKLPWSTEQEFESYIWKNKKPDKNSDELPIDANNHGMDAMRYFVAAVDGDAGKLSFIRGQERPSAQFRHW